jgi:hypothetical protein
VAHNVRAMNGGEQVEMIRWSAFTEILAAFCKLPEKITEEVTKELDSLRSESTDLTKKKVKL